MMIVDCVPALQRFGIWNSSAQWQWRKEIWWWNYRKKIQNESGTISKLIANSNWSYNVRSILQKCIVGSKALFSVVSQQIY